MANNSVTFQMTEVDLVFNNIKRLRNLAIEMFPEYCESKMFRLWVPRYVIDLIVVYNKEMYNLDVEKIHEGGNLFDFPVYYNSVDEITLGILDFHFFKENAPRITLSNFMTDKPMFK